MSSRAVTITLNPAIDQTVRLANLQPGHVHRARSSRDDAGGKGINVAACLADWGVPTTALGDGNDGVFSALFSDRGIADACLRIPGRTRTNIKLVEDANGETTDINLPGLSLCDADLDAVSRRLDALLQPQLPVVLSGSLPSGLQADAWARLQAQVRAAGARVLLDTSGDALAAALSGAQGALPYAVKPNRHELEAWAGTPLLDRSALRAAGRALVERGVALVAISMGADGALFIDRSGALVARPARLAQGSTVGAGDAMVAGITAALLEPSPDLAGYARLARVDRRCTDRAVGLKPLQRRLRLALGHRWPLLQGRTRRIPGVAMQASTVVIAAGERSIEAVLAAEALRRAARQQRVELAIEIRSNQGVTGALPDAQAAAATQLLLVGDGEVDSARFGNAQIVRAGLGEVLDDPLAVLAQLAAASAPPSRDDAGKRIVAVTSCPTGIAHTFMAAEGLQQAAKALGHAIRVETQGSVGAQDALSDGEIAAADLVLIAADREVDLSRFAGKRLFKSGTKPAINDGQNLIRKALAEAGVQTGTVASGRTTEKARVTGPYKHLMTGVSFMLPFVTAGGLLIEIGAKSGFMLMVPALAGYIAYSIADRPGIAPGMIGGLVAVNMDAGFIGGILAGFIAGYGVHWINRALRLPRSLEGLKPVLILPVLGTLLVGLLMMYVIGTPVAGLLAWLTDWLRGMQGSSAILLGLLLGGMMAVDMGGPVNKASYAFSTALISSQVYTPMAATMIGGMTPPLGIALATWLFSSRFTAEERGTAGAAGVLGLSFVTEGAIPYAARDPLRTIPALILGSAVAGAISMAAGVELKVPHGGVFVLPIPNAVTHLGIYLLALVAGVAVTAVALRVLKKPVTAPTL